MLSDGRELLIPGEGANVAPDDPDGPEDKKNEA